MLIEFELAGFLIFLAVATLVAFFAARARIPYSIAMIAVGLGIAILQLQADFIRDIRLNPELILIIFLPGLLFEASYNINLGQLRRSLKIILTLAIPGVIMSTVIVGYLLNAQLGLDLQQALLFGVLISATDPIAVVSIFKELGVDKRLSIIVEGESLFNDGVAVVGFTLLVGAIAGQQAINPTSGLVFFLSEVIGGVVLGAAAGFLFATLMSRTEEPLIDIALTVLLAYGVYFLAEQFLHGEAEGVMFGVSPVIAVVIAGLVVGNYGARGGYSSTSTNMIVTFWEFMVFLITSAVFLLIGLEGPLPLMVDNIVAILLAIVSILATRAIVIYVLRLVLNWRREQIPLNWAHVLFWGGMRGSVSIALALSLPFAVPDRSLLLALTFGYVLFSVIVQGITMQPLLARLGLARKSEHAREFETSLAQMTTTQASLAALKDLQSQHLLSKTVVANLEGALEERMEELQAELNRLLLENPAAAEENVRMVEREIAEMQKKSLLLLKQRGMISEDIYGEQMAQINTRLVYQKEGDLDEPDKFTRILERQIEKNIRAEQETEEPTS